MIGTSTRDTPSAETPQKGLHIVRGNIADESFVDQIVKEHKPDEIYNLASISTVAEPWDNSATIARVTGLAPLYFLNAIRKFAPATRFFQASSAEMYGNPSVSPQDELTPFSPQNPYGAAKLFAHTMIEMYRKKLGIFAVSGILFNHESPRRPLGFVTRKITHTLAVIAKGSSEVLELGNLSAECDWSFAGDIAEGMRLSLQHDVADTYVFASGHVHTVREFVEESARLLGMGLSWKGSGAHEIGVDGKGRTIVRVNPSFMRPQSVHPRCGNITKARKMLGWEPRVSFSELVAMMVRSEQKKGT